MSSCRNDNLKNEIEKQRNITLKTKGEIKKIGDVPLPASYERVHTEPNSFGEWLRQLEFKKNNTIYLYDAASLIGGTPYKIVTLLARQNANYSMLFPLHTKDSFGIL